MKMSRLPVLLFALLVLLTLPAGADVRTTPQMDGPPTASASIEGTITSLNVPTAGGGPIVTLLGGLVTFDATGAKVRLADGSDATTADLAVGQRIVAFVDASVSPLKATSIVVFPHRDDVTLTGKVDAVDTTAGTLTVLGFTVKVTDKTAFGGRGDGEGQTGLADLAVGDLVLVAAKAESGSLVATKVMKLAPSTDSMVRIKGVVDSIGTDSWTVTTRNGTKTVVKVTAETKIVGDPKVGDQVDVLARRQSDGSLVAALIAKSIPPPTVPTERFHGVVKSIGPTSWTIGHKAGDGPDRVFAVDAKTQILGDPKVGDEVGVIAQKQADGSFLAIVIAKDVVPPPFVAASFDGVVKSISPGTPAGVWLVDTTKVVVSRMTVVKGDPKVGDKVHVEGRSNPDGTVLATLIAKLP